MPFNDSDADAPLPALLHAARGAYSRTIREHLAYIVGGLTLPVHAGRLFLELGLRESVAHRLMHALLERGFVQPGPGVPKFEVPDLELLEKGRIAAAAASTGVAAVNDELAAMLSAHELSAFRTGLLALIDIKERAEERRE
jgi:hypothetical protein